MSRCFPYPPPGYAGKVARTEAALIESIKLQSERQQSKHDRKKEKSKHRKERSEKSKEKKQRRKERKEKSSCSCDLNDQKQKECAKQAEDRLKGTKVEAEQLEKSGLTEEHGQPVWPQSPGYLSDGTQINHKRKRDAKLQPNEDSKPGKIIRIKLASSLSNQEDSSADTQQTCSTSGRYDCVDQKRDENSCGPNQQKPCFTNSNTVVAVEEAPPKPRIKDHSRSVHAVKDIRPQGNVVPFPTRTRSPAESEYEALFEKWIPPPLQLEQQMDDEEWLFGTRKQDGQTTKATTNKAFSPVPSCRSSSLWPRGQYLPDADVYSLPYTIPF
ncbi:chromatin assembly factor 1 subunit A-like [Momordica charantia]|uniref:Chromatin assembly factor 1 subunit A-like n=1 Tax=Momordica charantia TaxID=3673 RepID=A0A6J1CT76_MOMCH|nr:chromatin assembly factor 1 subunit A-like [Momordica charantia]